MSKHTPPALEVRRTRCDCHPETCCCPEWELTFHGDVISRGSEEFICRALSKMTGFARAVNAHERLLSLLQRIQTHIAVGCKPERGYGTAHTELAIDIDAALSAAKE